MTIIEQLVDDFRSQNPSATPEEIKQYIQSLEQHTKVIKEDEWAVNTDQEYSNSAEAEDNTIAEGDKTTGSVISE